MPGNLNFADLKKAVTADLKSIRAVRRVAPHPSNPGVLIAYL